MRFRPRALAGCLGLVALGVIALGLIPSGTRAAVSAIVDFETGPPIGQAVNDEYASTAFVYWQRSDPGFRPYRRTAGVPTRSGTVAADISPAHCYPEEEDNPAHCELVGGGTQARLTRGAHAISLYTGLFAAAGDSVFATLTAFNAGGTPLASSSAPIGVGITTPLSVSSGAADIARFELVASGPGSPGAALGFDDLTVQVPDPPCPDPTIDSEHFDRVSSAAELATRLESNFTGRLLVPRDVRWEMEDCLGAPLRNLPVDSGVQIVGERGALGSRPILFTDDRGQPNYDLFKVSGNDVLIDGLHLRGPFVPKDRRDEEVPRIAAIAVEVAKGQVGRNVSISGNEIARFSNAVAVRSTIAVNTPKEYADACEGPNPEGVVWSCPPLTKSDAGEVRVSRNYIHNQQAYGGGYGVVVAGGAYASALGNVFESNNHSLAATGQAHSGYIARFNYALESVYRNGGSYPHHFDVHGREQPGSWAGGPAGTYFLVADNTFRGKQGFGFLKVRAAFALRGRVADAAIMRDNVFTHEDFADATKFSPGNDRRLNPLFPATFNFVNGGGNRYDTDHTREIATGDFDEDGLTDVFVATGTSWFISRGGVRPWEFVDASTRRTRDLGFADVDNDGRTDIVYRRDNKRLTYFELGSSPSIQLPRSPVPVSALRFGDFDGDGLTDIFYTEDRKWHVWYGSSRRWTETASSVTPVGEMLFGEFDDVPGTDIAAVRNNAWSYSSGARSRWARLNRKLTDSLRNAVAADFDADGVTDIAVRYEQMWRYSSGGRSALVRLRRGSEPLKQELVGHFVARPQAQVLTFEPFGLRFSVWHGLGAADRFYLLSQQNMR